jgi:hypothetical protein
MITINAHEKTKKLLYINKNLENCFELKSWVYNLKLIDGAAKINSDKMMYNLKIVIA